MAELLLAFLLTSATAALGACDETQLCPAGENPCVVDRARCVAPGTTIDVRPRTLLVNKRITVGEGTEAVFIRAGEVVVAAGGGFEVTGETGTLGRGGELHVQATGRISLQASGTTRSRIEANGGLQGGVIVLDAGHDLIDLGTIAANASSTLGTGGVVRMTSRGGYVWIGTGGVAATGGSNGSEGASGGEIAVVAATTVLVEGPVDASNGDCFGCSVALEARAGNLTLAEAAVVSVSASGGFGDGGSIVFDAAGTVLLHGTVRAVAKGSGGEDGGAGTAGTLDVVARDGVRIAGEVDLSGAGPDGDAGRVNIDAGGELAITGRVRLDTDGAGFGGDAFLVATSFVLTGEVTAHADEFGGSVDILAGTTALVGGRVTADGSWRSGRIDVEACTLDLPATAALTATGGPALGARGVTLSAGGSLTIGGEVVSGDAIRLAYRASPPVVLPSASLTPNPELFLDEDLACCGACATSSTSTSSTTTSSSSSSSSSSVSSSVTSTSSSSSSTSPSTSTSTTAISSSTVSTSPPSTATSTSSSSSTTSSSTSTSTSMPPEDPCADAGTPAEARIRCKMSDATKLLDAEAPTSARGVRRVRTLRRWARKIDARLAGATTAFRRERALRFTVRLVHRMERHVSRAARRGDVSPTLATLLAPVLAETEAIVGGAASP